MLPYDSKGEYTPEEVKDELSGVNGSRQLSYRYARLNQNNDYLEDIDYVQSCSIENNALADIKRTARFNILDTGTINYLQDRIMPLVRLAMPKDKGYTEAVETTDPDIWWKLDDPLALSNITNNVAITDGLDYATRETAYTGTTDSGQQYTPKYQTGSATLRNEFWVSYAITASDALEFRFKQTAGTGTTTYEVYSSSTADSELSLEHTTTSGTNVISFWTSISPARGFLYIRAWGTDTTASRTVEVSAKRRSRFEDSSKNHVKSSAYNWTMNQPSLVGTGTGAKVNTGTTPSNAATIITEADMGLEMDNALTFNWWVDVDNAFMNQSSQTLTDIFVTVSDQAWYMVFDIRSQSTANPNLSGSLSLSNFYGTFDIPKAMLESGSHMLTFIYEPLAERAELWVDGSFFTTIVDSVGDPLSLSNEGFIGSTLKKIEWKAWTTTGSVVIDDITVSCKALSRSAISSMYSLGFSGNAGPKRSGYVEWPQGVFVLSSPTRTMADGNTVTREVEGYDQLVVLKEDSFDYRYSVKAGAKYTEAISAVVQSSKAVSDYPVDETWALEGNAVILSEDSVRLDTVDANQVAVYSNMVTLQDIQISARMDAPTSPSTSRTIMSVNYWTTIDGEAKQMWIEKSGTQIEFVYNNFSYVSTWNAINDGFWRMRESNGFFYWETSADRKTWVERRKVKLTDDTFADANISFVADHGQAVIGSGAHEISFTGRGKAAMDITKSVAKLPTAMEWEPGTPKLTIVNDLLDAINYQSATYSERGAFIGRPYVSPADRTPQYRYATDAESVITGDVGQTVDLFKVPNKWIIVVSDPDRPSLVGEYVNNDPHSPTSTVSRGRTIVDYRTEQAAPDQLTLDAQAARLAFEASQVYEAIEFQTALMPIHQNNDVYELVIDGLGVDGKYSEQTWSMELKNGALMSHRVRRVVSV